MYSYMSMFIFSGFLFFKLWVMSFHQIWILFKTWQNFDSWILHCSFWGWGSTFETIEWRTTDISEFKISNNKSKIKIWNSIFGNKITNDEFSILYFRSFCLFKFFGHSIYDNSSNCKFLKYSSFFKLWNFENLLIIEIEHFRKIGKFSELKFF